MIALIRAGATFLTPAMGFDGPPCHLAEWTASLGLIQAQLISSLAFFGMSRGCFLDSISMVVLTTGERMPTVYAAGINPIWFGTFILLVVDVAH